MDPILTGAFLVALYKATELVWKKGFDAAWDPVDKGLKERFSRWAGTDTDSEREAAFAKAAAVARDLTLRQAADRQQAGAIWEILDTHPDRRAAEALAEEAAKLMLFSAAPDVPRLTEACNRALRYEALLKGERPPEPEAVAQFLGDYLTNLREALLDQRAYEDLVQKEMLRALRKIAEPAVPPADEASYRYQVAELHRRLEFVGIPELKERRPITVEDIFIRLRAEREIEVGPRSYAEMERELFEEDPEMAGGSASSATQWLLSLQADEEGHGETRRIVKERVGITEALGESRKMVVLGDPGTGKTTLLKYLTVICAEGRAGEELGLEAIGGGSPLPVFIPLRAFAAECAQRNEDYCLLDFFTTYARERLLLTLPPGFFEEALEAGRCLVCLDGLDEVWAVGQRKAITDSVMALATRYPRNRYVVTSRIVGYGEAPLDRRAYAHHTVLPLEDGDIAEFVEKWYRARERNPKRRREQIEDLVGTIERESRIQTLARNPLLLTIIALVHRIEAELPHERVKLYDKCVTALVDTWDEVRGLAMEEKQRPFYKYKRRLLERLAYELHSRDDPARAPNEGERGAATIKAGDLEVLLTRLIMEFRRLGFEDDPDGAREEARALVRLARGRTGLLVEQGEGRFSFPHLTFQEYLAANDVENRCIHRGVDALWEEMAPRLHEAHWREVILLLLGSLNKYDEPPTLLVKRILEAGEEDRFEPVLHRHLILAARALGDRVDVAADLRRRVVDQLLEIAASAPFWEGNDALTALGWLEGDGYAADGLLALARDNQVDDLVRSDAALVLGQLGRADQPAELLLALARDNQVDAGVRSYAAQALGQLGRADQAVLDGTLALARDNQVDDWVRSYAAIALGQLGRTDQASELLLDMAFDNQVYDWVRSGAARALGQLGRADQAVLDGLLALARDNQVSDRVRSAAAQALDQLGRPDQAAELLLTLARDPQVANFVRGAAAQALGQLGRPDQAAELLLTLARDPQVGRGVRSYAAQALGQLGCVVEVALEGLLALACDGHGDTGVRRTAAQALGQLGRPDDAVLECLLALARDDQTDNLVRCAATQALVQLGRADDTVLDSLLALTRDNQVDAGVRCDAAQALGQLGRADVAAKLLLSFARDNRVDTRVRCDAAQALGQLGRADQAAFDGLLALARDSQVPDSVRRDAAHALGQLGRSEQSSEEQVFALVGRDSASALGLPGRMEAVLDGLLALARDEEEDDQVRYASYGSLKQWLGSD